MGGEVLTGIGRGLYMAYWKLLKGVYVGWFPTTITRIPRRDTLISYLVDEIKVYIFERYSDVLSVSLKVL